MEFYRDLLWVSVCVLLVIKLPCAKLTHSKNTRSLQKPHCPGPQTGWLRLSTRVAMHTHADPGPHCPKAETTRSTGERACLAFQL